MKKQLYILAAATLVILMSASLANASTLDIKIEPKKPVIMPLEDQILTATTNEGGAGILFVIQPATGSTWKYFLNAHPLLKAAWNKLSYDVQTQISNKIGNKIVSYKIVTMGEGSKDYVFPDDFKGINGEPSTMLKGEYKVVFGFGSIEWCRCIDIDFDCDSCYWHVIPEVPLGTVMAVGAPIAAFATVKVFKKRRISH